MFCVRWYNGWLRCSVLGGRMGGRDLLCEMVQFMAEMLSGKMGG